MSTVKSTPAPVHGPHWTVNYRSVQRREMWRDFIKAAVIVAIILLCSIPFARSAEIDANGNGVVRSHKTGAHARVSPRYAARFQAYINDLEAAGAKILFMGGYRHGHCSSRHMHPCGRALDVCQYRRGVVDRRCHLPGRAAIAEIAERHGLFEGGQWCNSDYGHAQAGISAGACGTTMAAARRHHRQRVIAKHHRHGRYASN